jgi:hypothetical protein
LRLGETFCAEGVTYYFDTCGNPAGVKQNCECGCNPDHTGCQTCQGCTERDRTICQNGGTYWVDSCGHLGDLIEQCQCGCSLDGLTCESCPGCTPNVATTCQGDVTYWMDSCGNLGEVIDACACGCNPEHTGCQTCADCTPGAGTTCQGGVKYWIDSCGNLGPVIETCACGCDAAGVGCANCTCTPDCSGKQCGPDGCGGTCGPGCRADQTCTAGACVCPAGRTECASVCVNTQSDPQNCGGCGVACGPAEACVSGSCMGGTIVGGSCTDDSQCGANGYCLSGQQGFPGGYCLVLNCSDSNPCPAGNDCYTLFSDGTTACIKHCTQDSECRTQDGYICDSYNTCWPGCQGDDDCPEFYTCDVGTGECVEEPECTPGSCPEGQVCAGGHCVMDVGDGPGQNTAFPLDQLNTLCPDLPPVECSGTAAYCGELVPFDPDYGPGYIDYPENGETWNNQYRSYLRRDLMMLIKYACAYVDCLAANWTVGNGEPLGLIDMSEADGSIPGTSTGSPGHPQGTHTNGFDIDVAYYQVGTADNRARPVCDHYENGQEAYHCTADPHLLDPWRTALFLGATFQHPYLRVIGADGKVGPQLDAARQQLCATGWLDGSSCTTNKLTYEETDTGRGWYYFHHHHMHISISRPNYTRSADRPVDQECLVPGCLEKPYREFLQSMNIR